MNLQYFI